MLALILRRLFAGVIVMVAVALLSFIIFNFLGDPITSIAGQDATLEQREALRQQLGLDDPTIVQFGRFVGRSIQGEFGLSYRSMEPVLQVILERLPATLELVLVSAVFALVIGILMGIYCGIYPDGWLSRLMQLVSLIGVSLPQFLIGILLILVFSVELRWLTGFGRGETVQLGWWSTGLLTASGLKALILPSVTLGLYQMTLVMRLVRAEMLEVLRTDYVRFARARGLTSYAIYFRHALRNALIPVITVTGLQIGSLIAFAIVVETVFQWPGLGLLIIQAINFADFPVMAAYLSLVGLMFVFINLVVDLLYYVVDPRLRVE